MPAPQGCSRTLAASSYADVEQRDVGMELRHELECAFTVVRDSHVLVLEGQQHFKTVRGVAIVVGDQHAHRMRRVARRDRR